MEMKKSKIYGEMHLVFHNDFDVFSITQLLKIVPSDCQNRCDTRISPITHEHNPGYWTLKTAEYETWDLKPVLDELLGGISDKLSMIKQVCDENGGEVSFCFVPIFTNESTPSLFLTHDFLEAVHFLNATVDFDLYVNP